MWGIAAFAQNASEAPTNLGWLGVGGWGGKILCVRTNNHYSAGWIVRRRTISSPENVRYTATEDVPHRGQSCRLAYVRHRSCSDEAGEFRMVPDSENRDAYEATDRSIFATYLPGLGRLGQIPEATSARKLVGDVQGRPGPAYTSIPVVYQGAEWSSIACYSNFQRSSI